MSSAPGVHHPCTIFNMHQSSSSGVIIISLSSLSSSAAPSTCTSAASAAARSRYSSSHHRPDSSQSFLCVARRSAFVCIAAAHTSSTFTSSGSISRLDFSQLLSSSSVLHCSLPCSAAGVANRIALHPAPALSCLSICPLVAS